MNETTQRYYAMAYTTWLDSAQREAQTAPIEFAPSTFDFPRIESWTHRDYAPSILPMNRLTPIPSIMGRVSVVSSMTTNAPNPRPAPLAVGIAA